MLALFEQYRREGEPFVPKYLQMLAAGGSLSPPELMGRLGVDISRPEFWDQGLSLLSGMVDQAETLATQVLS